MGAFRLFTVLMLTGLLALARAQQFASVVIKPSASSDPGASRLQILPGGELIGHSVLVADLIDLAYAVPSNPSPRLVSLPEWAGRQHFDIEAKTAASLELGAKKIPAQKQTIELLLRKLLSDKFGLLLRTRRLTTPVYALTLTGTDQNLTPSSISPSDCIFDTASAGCHSFAIGFGHPLNTRAVDMSDLALYLENWTDLPVVDRTGKAGLFEMHSKGWQPMKLPPPPPGSSATGAEFATLSTLSAVLSTFGLQLHRVEESLPFYTVERLHPPNAR